MTRRWDVARTFIDAYGVLTTLDRGPVQSTAARASALDGTTGVAGDVALAFDAAMQAASDAHVPNAIASAWH